MNESNQQHRIREEVEEIQKAAARLRKYTPQQLLQWGLDQYGGKIVLACSTGAEDVVLVDMMSRITPSPQIFFLDTEKHFSETYKTLNRIEQRYNIAVKRLKPKLTLEEQETTYGDHLWQHDPDRCCHIRKVEPLREHLRKYEAWITGVRREQSPTRSQAQKVEWDQKFGLLKLNPLVDWTWQDVWNYIRTNQVPYHPLHDVDYPSIGCSVCTRSVKPGEDLRAGRWSGTNKLECGLHQ